ncbi:hypothetical protein GGS23DRAFT_314215 [Durotheca rogersii]|uniref:uncharacterized protein n=1 Tax=Durotheca rogersii TaxID=419775 RepID=UPI0022206604|nr:uncharacterized protein GGS23DRAFT_314215 [Durotheca rogersii]KAI5859583.1 hypothetical protein GGS23DRAFT_314215 [Durotheca rogersii]
MLRRPPGEGRHIAQQRKVLLALAVFLLPWLQLVDARQRQPSPDQAPPIPNYLNDNADSNVAVNKHHVHDRDIPNPRFESTFEANHVLGDNRAAATHPKARSAHGTPSASRKSTVATAGSGRSADKKRFANILVPNDASALATLAPAQSVRAPNSLRHLPSLLAGAGLSSPQTARSLERWEVEDYVLLATVDGHLYAVNRESGDERWHLQVEQPIVETIHHRLNNSLGDDQDERDRHPLDDYVWAVEPTRDGALYVWSPSGFGSGLVSTGLTMKQLVEDFGSYAVQSPPVVYTGHKKTTMISLDAATGRVLKWFGQSGSQVDQSATCYPPNGRFADSDNGECSNTGIITLGRTEYTVTIHRSDDGREIATLRYAEWGPNNFDNDLHQQYQATQDNRYFTSQHDGKVYALAHPTGATSFALQFSVPVARVFDVARPEDVPPGTNPELVLLPQPTPPIRDEDSARARSHSVFLNQTESGSWYAMSGWSYPLIVDAPAARVSRGNPWDMLDAAAADQSLVGTHVLGNARSVPQWPQNLPPSLPSRPSPPDVSTDDADPTASSPFPDTVSEPPSLAHKVSAIPQYAADKTLDFLMNPILFPVLIYLLFRYYKDLVRWTKRQIGPKEYPETLTFVPSTAPGINPPPDVVNEEARPLDRDPVVKQSEPTAPIEAGRPEKDVTATIPSPDPEGADVDGEREQQQTEGESPEKKKKMHRGRRGGVKHRKGAKKPRDASENTGDRDSPDAGEGIPGLQNVGMPPKLEPNVMTMNNDPEDVSGPIVRIGGIEVNQDEQLGMGSNGTIVFAGKFHGRDVAVKRMLTQFWDIATQETQLLLESDHHPNVIRYFAMSKNDSFLYIALELCQASLSDIIEKPALYRDLAHAGEVDLPRVLLQIAHGLGFLHDLRIVHRDLKPQNILVTMGRDGKPRLLVSDFGLCKKLEGGQSSFGATTAHAAGTSGWRAPELLLDDDARESSTMSMTSTHSDSSQLVSADVMPNRRATRAIDIFSLGLVFFYVLTKGLHPFDCGDRYMREVNIRKGQFNLKPLDMLGDVSHEAKALIETMLRSDPRARPSAKDVMSHPFFWSPKERLAFLCDVSDHFELEPRDPPSKSLMELEAYAPQVCRGDFLKALPKEFVDSLGKQRKYTGSKLLDLLRALRNKRFHYGDMSEPLKKLVGSLPDGYLGFWTRRFPNLLIVCCEVVYKLNLEELHTFKEYFKPRTPL